MLLDIKSIKFLSLHPAFWVTLSLALVITPHLSRFPTWSIFFISLLLTWRLITIKKNNWSPPKWLLAILTILTCIGIFIHFGTMFGKTAGSVLLSILLTIKLHESYTRRDYMLLITLSFFIIITNFLFSQSIPTVLLMISIIMVLVISMISINQGDSPVNTWKKTKLAVKMLVQAIPLMLILFVLFPRISGPLWQLPDEQQTATTGLSDTMSPGNISNLTKSRAVAFRVKFNKKIPQQNKLYWRALVLWYFDGKTWEQGKQNLTPSPGLYSYGGIIDYTITLEPHHKKWLYALDIPTVIPANITYTNNFVLRTRNEINSLYQYNLKSALEYAIQTDLSPWEKSAGLKVPLNTNPRTIQYGKQLAIQYQQTDDIVNHVLNMFNQQDFHYTLNPPLTPGFDPVDQFLFDSRRGFCEHYASSFTLLMRAAGIPSRVVLGYQGGTINPLNKIMTVRQSDAHAWSEVWLEKRGWVRIDPTATIAPQRIEINLEAALDPSELLPFHMRINNGLIKDLTFFWDAIDNEWNQWVVGYDSTLQKRLFDTILNQRIELSEIILLMVIFFTSGLIIISLTIIKPWHKEKIDPVVKTYNQFCRKLSTVGIHREPYEGPVDFATRAIDQLPEKKAAIELITRLYTKLRYETSGIERHLKQLKQLTRNFKAR